MPARALQGTSALALKIATEMLDPTMHDRTSEAPARFLIGAEGGEEVVAADLSAGPEPPAFGLSSAADLSHAAGLRATGLVRRYPAARGGEFCSHAGLQQRPWLARLRRALREGLFVLHYQPIVCLRTGVISHHEALLRLADEPDGGLVAPGCFLPAAERCGLVREIDRLVLREAISLMGSLADREAPVAVNLSALSVTGPGTLSYLAAQLGAHGVEPGRLILEVTETAAISDMARASAFCAGARQLGCAVALDDFGSGFGSFAYLKRLPFDLLKIDGDFVRSLPRSRSDQLVVQALVSVAKGLGKRTIAEYVEGQETIELLRAYGVDCAQGFAIGRPVAPVEAFALAA